MTYPSHFTAMHVVIVLQQYVYAWIIQVKSVCIHMSFHLNFLLICSISPLLFSIHFLISNLPNNRDFYMADHILFPFPRDYTGFFHLSVFQIRSSIC